MTRSILRLALISGVLIQMIRIIPPVHAAEKDMKLLKSRSAPSALVSSILSLGLKATQASSATRSRLSNSQAIRPLATYQPNDFRSRLKNHAEGASLRSVQKNSISHPFSLIPIISQKINYDGRSFPYSFPYYEDEDDKKTPAALARDYGFSYLIHTTSCSNISQIINSGMLLPGQAGFLGNIKVLLLETHSRKDPLRVMTVRGVQSQIIGLNLSNF